MIDQIRPEISENLLTGRVTKYAYILLSILESNKFGAVCITASF